MFGLLLQFQWTLCVVEVGVCRGHLPSAVGEAEEEVGPLRLAVSPPFALCPAFVSSFTDILWAPTVAWGCAKTLASAICPKDGFCLVEGLLLLSPAFRPSALPARGTKLGSGPR